MINPLPIEAGDPFGHWTVLSRYGRDTHGGALWTCRCVCGTERPVAAKRLRAGKSLSCGCGALKVKVEAAARNTVNLGKSHWTADEERTLLALRLDGVSWARVSLAIPGRSWKACKTHSETLAAFGYATPSDVPPVRVSTRTPSPASAAQRSPAAEIRPQTRPCEARPAGGKPAILASVPRCTATDPDTGLRCTVACHGRATMCPACLDRTAWHRAQRAARRRISA